MKSTHLYSKTVLMLLTLALCGVGTARAQYSHAPNAQGGQDITGSGGALGPLSLTSTPPLSGGGFDNVILIVGSTATGSGVDTIAFTASNDLILNNGTVIGSDGVNPGDSGFNAISFNTVLTSLSNVTITNNHGAFGGSGQDGSLGGAGGSAISVFSFDFLNNVMVANTGTASVGNGGADNTLGGGAGGSGISISTQVNSMSGIQVGNTGIIFGGNGGESTATGGGPGGSGISINSFGGISYLVLNNIGGHIIGGDAGLGATNGGFAGNGISITTDIGSVDHVTLNNTGSVAGGNGGFGLSSDGGDGGHGIFIAPSADITTLVLSNSGPVSGGVGGAGVSNGGFGGVGIWITSETADVNGVVFANIGSVNGGAGGTGTQGGVGGAGILITTGFGNMSNVTAASSGQVTGGSGGTGVDGGVVYVPGGAGGNGADAIGIASAGTLNLVSLINGGPATGGVGAGGGMGGSDVNGSADGGMGGNGGNGLAIGGTGNMGSITLVNNGSATGGNAGNGGAGGVANGPTNFGNGAVGGTGGNGITVFTSANNITGITITNNGSATGGAGGNGGDGGAGGVGNAGDGGTGGIGLSVNAGGNITGLNLTNNGQITGGAGGNGSSVGPFTEGGDGQDALFIGADTLIGTVVTNNGTIVGGKGGGGPFGESGGEGVDIETGIVNGFTFINNGSVTGGGGGTGHEGGRALGLEGDMTNVTFINNGSMTGGAGGSNGGSGNDAVLFAPLNGNINSLTIINNGVLASGAGTSGTDGGGSGAFGLSVSSFLGNSTNNVTVTNNGLIAGGNGADGGIGGGGDGEDGVRITSGLALTNVNFTNNGTVTGGNGGTGAGGGNSAFGGNGMYFGAHDAINNVNVINKGIILGGNGGTGSNHPDGGDGIGFFIGAPGTTSTITNLGIIAGGNAGSAPGQAGVGVYSNSSNIVVNNWGVISSGAGPNPAAIRYFDVLNNVINLNGHSAVNGLIAVNGFAPDTNHLNLNFTGMSPAAIAALTAQLNAQNLLTGHDSAGTFTVRNVVYTYDPAVLGLNVSSYQTQGVTMSQQAVGRALDSALVNPAPGTSLFNLFNAIDMSGNVPGALEALSPQAYQIYGDLAIANSTATVQNVDARLNNLRDGSESIDTTGVGGALDATTTAGFSKDSSKDSKQVVTPPAEEKRWGFFATGDGLFFRGNSHNVDLQQGKSNTAGTLAGVDGKAGEHAVIGALFSYNNADADFGGNGMGNHATIESYTGGIYGSYHNDGFYVNALAAYTRNNYTSQRSIVFPGFATNANGSTNGNQYTANLDGGYDWHVTDRLTMGPLAGLQYVHLDVDGFNEAGAGAAGLALNSQSMDSLQSRLGGRIDYHLRTTATNSVALDLHAAWQHEYLNDSRSIGAGFEGAGLAPFSVQTAAPLRDAAVVGFGMNFTFHDRLTLFADYELQFWQSSYFEQTVNGGAKISF